MCKNALYFPKRSRTWKVGYQQSYLGDTRPQALCVSAVPVLSGAFRIEAANGNHLIKILQEPSTQIRSSSSSAI